MLKILCMPCYLQSNLENLQPWPQVLQYHHSVTPTETQPLALPDTTATFAIALGHAFDHACTQAMPCTTDAHLMVVRQPELFGVDWRGEPPI